MPYHEVVHPSVAYLQPRGNALKGKAFHPVELVKDLRTNVVPARHVCPPLSA